MLKTLSIAFLVLVSLSVHANPTSTWMDCHQESIKANDCDSELADTLRAGLDSLANRIALKVSPENSTKTVNAIYRSLDSFQDYAESFCYAASDKSIPHSEMECFALQMRTQGGLMLDMIEGKGDFKKAKVVTAATRPVKHKGKAPGNDSDFARMEVNSDMAATIAAMSKCPAKDKFKHECVHGIGLVTAELLYKSNLSTDKMLKQLFAEDPRNAAYWNYIARKSSSTFIAMVISAKSEKGRQLLLEGGYITPDTAAYIKRKVESRKVK